MFHKYDYGTCDHSMGRQLESQYLETESKPFNYSVALGIILLEISAVLIVCLLRTSNRPVLLDSAIAASKSASGR